MLKCEDPMEGGENDAGIHAADEGRVAGRRGRSSWIGLSALGVLGWAGS